MNTEKKKSKSYYVNIGFVLLVSVIALFIIFTDSSFTQNGNLNLSTHKTEKTQTENKATVRLDEQELVHLFQGMLDKHFKDMTVYSATYISETSLYMLKVNGGTFYSNLSGSRVIIPGQGGSPSLVDLSGDVYEDISVALSKPINKKLIEGFSGGITYKAKNEIAKVVVFTDPACAYCQKLHHDMDQYLAKGITVQYAPMPIFGKSSEEALVRVYSSVDPKSALNFVKGEFSARRGANIDWDAAGLSNTDSKMAEFVANGTKLGKQLGFMGTPGIVLSDGTLIAGYLNADKLLAQIQKNLK